MIGKTTRPASLFAFAFFKEAALIADSILDPLDRLLEDPRLLALSTQVLARRSPSSTKAGHPLRIRKKSTPECPLPLDGAMTRSPMTLKFTRQRLAPAEAKDPTDLPWRSH